MRTQDAAFKEAANSELRRLLAYSKSFNCTDITIGDFVPFYKAQGCKRSPRNRRAIDETGKAAIDETGGAATLQSQTFKVAQYCAREKLAEKDVIEEE